MMTPTPELDKMKAVHTESQAIGEFLDYSPYTLCDWDEDTNRFWPVQGGIERILAEFFDIDLDKVEAEKLAILEELRAANG